MDAKELIEQGDIHLKKEEFPQAFSCYHEAHMQNNPYGTYKLAECFRIAFHMQNLDNIDYSKCREYARNAIKLYSISYKQLERYEDNLISYRQRVCDDILIKIIFLKRLINDSKCDLPEEAQLMQKFQENANEYLRFPYSEFAMFLSADIHRKVLFLLRLTKVYGANSVYIAEKYLRIAASVMAYKHSCSEVIYKLEAGDIVQCLIDANHLGAKFDVSNLCTKLQVSDGKRPPDELGIWRDVEPTEWDLDEEALERNWGDDPPSSRYETGTYFDEDGYCYDDGPDDINDAYDYYYNDDHDGYGEDY